MTVCSSIGRVIGLESIGYEFDSRHADFQSGDSLVEKYSTVTRNMQVRFLLITLLNKGD